MFLTPKRGKGVKLTHTVKCAGCAAKIPPALLKAAISGIDWPQDERLIVGFDRSDDAGVFQWDEDRALVQTTDFFTPLVDDPFTFGQIAAANALSDIYAMGGIPLTALNIVGYPAKLGPEILREILSGGANILKLAKCIPVGGHSVNLDEMFYGMAITGTVHPQKVWTLEKAQVGDQLILTKSIGTGVLNTALKAGKISSLYEKLLVQSMIHLNYNAMTVLQKFQVNACTDITGFSLMGHAMEMALASGVQFTLDSKNISWLPGAREAVKAKHLTRGDKNNRIYTQGKIYLADSVDKITDHLLYDPQSSGGLLVSIPEKQAHKALEALIEAGEENSSIIGEVKSADSHQVGQIGVS